MRLSVRILLGFFLIVGLAAYFVLRIFMQEVRPGVRQGMETALVDTAQLLAEIATEEFKAGTLNEGRFAEAVRQYQSRVPKAGIWGMEKRRSDFRVYVTDASGKVVYDSEGKLVDLDYSRWNDVYRTLRGEYGARSTRLDPQDESSSTMFVAAPIRDGDRIIGVLSVSTPTSSVIPFAKRSEQRVFRAGLILMGSAMLIGIGLTLWLTHAIGRLRTYARKVSEGQKATLPEGGGSELADLGRSLETMREKLEGRQYVERYVHTLTHEMKSPLAAIHGAALLLEEDLPEADRRRFVANIREQEERLQHLVERMLDLATIQHRQRLQDPVRISLVKLVDKVTAGKEPRMAQRGLKIECRVPVSAEVQGEAFLLEQALSNLLDNAIEFSPAGGIISICVESTADHHDLVVRDHGQGLPDFASERIFEPFYSLPRPDTQKKSTGLGLSFVKEVTELHQGRVEVRNHSEGGVEARLTLPVA